MNLDEALEVISNLMYVTYEELISGLPGGSDDEWNYDEALTVEIAEACLRWQSRQSRLENPYIVRFFDGESWSVVTDEMHQEDAYKEWYRLTDGATTQNNQSCETYYFLGLAREEVCGRHREEDADDFSISYLLAKSFGG